MEYEFYRAHLALEQQPISYLHPPLQLVVAVGFLAGWAEAPAAADYVNKPPQHGRGGGVIMLIVALCELPDDCVLVAPPKHGYTKAEECVCCIGLIHVLEYAKVSLKGPWRDEAKPRRDVVYGAHPEYGEDLALDEQLAECMATWI
jgi:hypothetical protein